MGCLPCARFIEEKCEEWERWDGGELKVYEGGFGAGKAVLGCVRVALELPVLRFRFSFFVFLVCVFFFLRRSHGGVLKIHGVFFFLYGIISYPQTLSLGSP